jgi:hypothetical protein
MSSLSLDVYSCNSDDRTTVPPSLLNVSEENIDFFRPLNSAFMINVTIQGMNDTHFSSLKPEVLVSNKISSESESIETEVFLERFKKISKEYAENKAASVRAGSNFMPIRDCYGVIDRLSQDEKSSQFFFEARIYKNSSNEFVEIIRAPTIAFKQSDAELLEIGSVFYWKVGYRSTPKGNRVKVNEFNLRRIIREKSALRSKRVEKVVGDLMSIFD